MLAGLEGSKSYTSLASLTPCGERVFAGISDFACQTTEIAWQIAKKRGQNIASAPGIVRIDAPDSPKGPLHTAAR